MDKAGRQWQAVASHERLQRRARLLKGIRAFFDARGVLEVETPLLSPTATTDPHIDSLQCRFRGRPYYLNTSPEYAMKRLLAAGAGAIYQVCKAFRDDVPGALHNPEFSLLEWYRPGFDMHRLMQELQALLAQCWQQSTTGTGFPGVNTVSYQQAFEQSIGLNPHTANAAQCYHSALAHNIEIPQGLGEKDPVNDWLDWFMLSVVAPGFGKNGFTFLYDYPASQCSLARLDRNEQGHTVAKRFELFYGEIELANGFDELTDADEQRRR
ncbi:MAG TPA: hypothetical protein ENJ11_01995, partial [Gammaproteobacteria bacterium]|nr:hypothetical protein [Gammaproteobacteria bacterium]